MLTLQPLFHGSPVRLARGSIILPGGEIRRRGRTPWVYLTTTVEDALFWAGARAHRDGFSEPDGDDSFGTRPTISLYAYQVDPIGLERVRGPIGIYRCRRARVLELARERLP